MKKFTFQLMLVCILVLTTGCSSVIDISNTQNLYRSGNFNSAYESLLAKQDMIIKSQGLIVMGLDAGLLSRLNGEYKHSNELLSDAERRIQEAYTESLTANISSFIVNDNTKAYQGEDYEDIYINVFKALNYIHLEQGESALVELRRSIEKQSLLKQKYEQQTRKVIDYAEKQGIDKATSNTYSSSFSSSALANYLTMVAARGIGDSNTFSYALDQISRSFATQEKLYPFPLPSSLQQEQMKLPEGKARLHVVAFNGLAPEKKEAVESIYVSRNNYAKIAYPILVGRHSEVQSIKVTLDDGTSFFLEKLESISGIAIDTFKAKSDVTRLKAITRSMIKAIGIAIYDGVAEEKAQKNNTTVSVAEELLGWVFKIASNVSESADVRSSHFLPSTAWVGATTLNPGVYDMKIEFRNNSGRTLHTQHISRYEVTESGINLKEAVCPL